MQSCTTADKEKGEVSSISSIKLCTGISNLTARCCSCGRRITGTNTRGSAFKPAMVRWGDPPDPKRLVPLTRQGALELRRIPARISWPGYDGECCIQQIGMQYGIYISQAMVRSWLSGAPLQVNVNEHLILEKLQLEFTQWDRKKRKKPQFPNFSAWIAPLALECTPVLLEVKKLDVAVAAKLKEENRRQNGSLMSRGSSRASARSARSVSQASEDPVPLIAAARNSVWLTTGSTPHAGTEYLSINTGMSKSSALKTILSLGLSNKVVGSDSRKYEVSVDRNCINACAVTGVKQILTHDGVPRLLPVEIVITNDAQKEPNPHEGEPKEFLKVNVIVKSLVAGQKYVLFRYKCLNDVPSALSEVADSLHVSALYFRPEEPTWISKEIVASDCTAYFRCMPALQGETERFSPVRPYSPDFSRNTNDYFRSPDDFDDFFDDFGPTPPSSLPRKLTIRPKPEKLTEIIERNELPDFMRKKNKKGGSPASSLTREAPNYNITVHIEGQEVLIYCGKGNQSLKWLALTAAARIAGMSKSKGRVRHREQIGACMEVKTVLPSILSSSKWASDTDLKQLRHRPPSAMKTTSGAFTEEYHNVGASYVIPERSTIWTPDKLAPQVALLTKKKQESSLKVAGKKQKVAKLQLSAIKVRGGNSVSESFPCSPGIIQCEEGTRATGTPGSHRSGSKIGDWDASRPSSRSRGRSQGTSRSGNSRPGSSGQNTKSRPGSSGQNRKARPRPRLQNSLGSTKDLNKGKNQSIHGDMPISPYKGRQTNEKNPSLVSQGGDVKAFLNAAFNQGNMKGGSAVDIGSAQNTSRSFVSSTWSSQGLGDGKHKVNPETLIKHVLKPTSHIWAELYEGNKEAISTWMDEAFYHGRNSERISNIQKKAQAVFVKEQAFWAVVAARKRVTKAKHFTTTTKLLIDDGVHETVEGISRIAIHFGKMLRRFMKKFLKLIDTDSDDVCTAKKALEFLTLLPAAVETMQKTKTMKNALSTLRLVEKAVVKAAELVNLKMKFDDPPKHTLAEMLKDLNPLIDRVSECERAVKTPDSEGNAWKAATEADNVAESAAALMGNVRRRAMEFDIWVKNCEEKFHQLNDGIEDFVEAAWDAQKERMGALTSFDHDWSNTQIDNVVPHREEYYKIRNICREYYHIIKGIFQHFCVIGNSASAEGDYTISLSEFMIFAKKIKVIDEERLHVTDVQRIFTLTNAGRNPDAASGDDQFECHEFMEALIRVAVIRFSKEMSGGVVEAVNYLFHKKLAHIYFHEIYDPHFREHLEHYRVQSVFRKYIHILDDVFEKVGCPLGAYDDAMDIGGFSKLINKAKLVDALLTRIEVKKAFVQSQMKPIYPDAWVDDDDNCLVEQEGSGNEENLEVFDQGALRAQAENISFRKMDFDEFKEALGRCAVYKWDDKSKYDLKPLDWKIEMILKSIVELDPLDQTSRRKKNARLGIDSNLL